MQSGKCPDWGAVFRKYLGQTHSLIHSSSPDQIFNQDLLCKLTQKLTVLFIPITAAIKHMQLPGTTITAGEHRPAPDGLWYTVMLLDVSLEHRPFILSLLHLSRAGDKQRSPGPPQGKRLQLTAPKRRSASPPLHRE